MERKPWKVYAFWIILTQAVGGLAAWLTRDGTALYRDVMQKPPLSPPAIVFPIEWVILYTLMAVGAARVSLAPASPQKHAALRVYGIQLFFNFCWSILFFNWQTYLFALIWLVALWVLILVMLSRFERVDPLAARLQIPYAVWVAFAAYLNAGVWLLNK